MNNHSRLLNKSSKKLFCAMLSIFVATSVATAGSTTVFGVAMNMAGMAPMLMPGTTPDYFGATPNYANSPLPELDAAGNIIPGTGIRKFVDSLPGLGAANANDLGQYIPVAVPDTTTYPGSDYYEIQLVQYTEKLHKDLPKTTLRGYVQVNTTDATVSKPNYLGPMIIAQKDRPVRVKFTNKLSTGTDGDLFLPVDTTTMGAGTGPKMGTENYSQNRATLHLHGGITPWISDGNPNQWITPAGEKTSYPTGVSVHNVPDMPDPGPGSETFFYTNQQSARLMFYHDHSYGITRLNVYAGEEAGYILQDKTEKDLIASGVIPADQIPLTIQDKTFVPKDAQLIAEDPTWDKTKWGGLGNLWFPHVYMPNQNPGDPSGANPMGRWDYGPWFWPPYTGLKNGPVDNPLYPGTIGEPAKNPGVPNISEVPEAYMDTPLVNGTAYPYLNVQPKSYRFRVLNGSNDRFWNLQFYTAKSSSIMWNANGTLNDANAGEVPMVPAVKTTGFPAAYPTDGREGGVPDPASTGPSITQIGTESGFLPAPVELTNQPIDYQYNRRDIVVLNISNKNLLLGPAERADVIVDFSKYAGKTLILYNDSPAPVPAFDPRNDYYTGDPDQTSEGGAPTTLPGYGPNTRTVMQIKVASAPVLASSYPLADITSTNAGSGYTTPAVSISGGGATVNATSTAIGSVDSISAITPGMGYTTAPTVAITGVGIATAATAKATISVTSASLKTQGSRYTSPPIVTITDSAGGIGTGATATATINKVTGVVNGITIITAGSNYTLPVVSISGGGSRTNATAGVTGVVDKISVVSGGAGYSKAPAVTLSGGGFIIAATAKATINVNSFVLTSPGAGYTTGASITITDSTGIGTGATAASVLGTPINMLNKALPAAYTASQNPLIVPEGVYSRIQDTSLTFAPVGSTTPLTYPMQSKAIQELFEPYYGRMNATMGMELPFTSATTQTTIPYGYIDPVTEIVNGFTKLPSPTLTDGTQIWKITHNGVDTHSIHFHLFDVQIVNRVGWDGAIRPPDPNEMGIKDTVRMNPLEDVIIALRPILPKTNFGIPDSIRPLDVTMPIGSTGQFMGIDPKTNNPITVTNQLYNFGWEYMWHCHLLGHEENDMMRPIEVDVPHVMPTASVLSLTKTGNSVNLTWTDPTPVSDPKTLGNPANEIAFTIQRALIDKNGKIGVYTQINQSLANSTSYTDVTINNRLRYSYRILTFNATGSINSNVVKTN